MALTAIQQLRRSYTPISPKPVHRTLLLAKIVVNWILTKHLHVIAAQQLEKNVTQLCMEISSATLLVTLLWLTSHKLVHKGKIQQTAQIHAPTAISSNKLVIAAQQSARSVNHCIMANIVMRRVTWTSQPSHWAALKLQWSQLHALMLVLLICIKHRFVIAVQILVLSAKMSSMEFIAMQSPKN